MSINSKVKSEEKNIDQYIAVTRVYGNSLGFGSTEYSKQSSTTIHSVEFDPFSIDCLVKFLAELEDDFKIDKLVTVDVRINNKSEDVWLSQDLLNYLKKIQTDGILMHITVIYKPKVSETKNEFIGSFFK